MIASLKPYVIIFRLRKKRRELLRHLRMTCVRG